MDRISHCLESKAWFRSEGATTFQSPFVHFKPNAKYNFENLEMMEIICLNGSSLEVSLIVCWVKKRKWSDGKLELILSVWINKVRKCTILRHGGCLTLLKAIQVEWQRQDNSLERGCEWERERERWDASNARVQIRNQFDWMIWDGLISWTTLRITNTWNAIIRIENCSISVLRLICHWKLLMLNWRILSAVAIFSWCWLFLSLLFLSLRLPFVSQLLRLVVMLSAYFLNSVYKRRKSNSIFLKILFFITRTTFDCWLPQQHCALSFIRIA